MLAINFVSKSLETKEMLIRKTQYTTVSKMLFFTQMKRQPPILKADKRTKHVSHCHPALMPRLRQIDSVLSTLFIERLYRAQSTSSRTACTPGYIDSKGKAKIFGSFSTVQIPHRSSSPSS